jgi:hypothetical protein
MRQPYRIGISLPALGTQIRKPEARKMRLGPSWDSLEHTSKPNDTESKTVSDFIRVTISRMKRMSRVGSEKTIRIQILLRNDFRSIWKDSVATYRTEIHCQGVDLIQLAQGRDQWLVVCERGSETSSSARGDNLVTLVCGH